jgi:hypothetical protein
MKRYDHAFDDSSMEENSDGDWVKHSDILPYIEAVKVMRGALEMVNKHSRGYNINGKLRMITDVESCGSNWNILMDIVLNALAQADQLLYKSDGGGK